MTKSVDEILADMYPDQPSLFEMEPPPAPAVRPDERIPEILALLQDAWMQNPDARFFQLLWNVFQTQDSLSTLHFMEDWQVEQALTRHLTEWTTTDGR